MKAKVHFLGAAGTVTGSKILLETPAGNILIDCGLFQGLKELRELNWQPIPFPAEKIDLVLLTHGHLDHSGYLPRLVKEGFQGKILGTAPTLAISAIILRDSGKIQEEDAARANQEGFSTHSPALPLYGVREAGLAISRFKAVETGIWIELLPGIRARFQLNGHILGSCFVELELEESRLVFSGDVGRTRDPLLPAPHKPMHADYLFLESTYGNRLHAREDSEKVLIDAVHKCIRNRGNLIIPT